MLCRSSQKSKKRAQFKPAANPVFKGMCNVWLHALIMSLLGCCNVFIPGMKAVKGVSAMRIASSGDTTCEDTLFTSLHKQFMDKNNNLSKQDVDTPYSLH